MEVGPTRTQTQEINKKELRNILRKDSEVYGKSTASSKLAAVFAREITSKPSDIFQILVQGYLQYLI